VNPRTLEEVRAAIKLRHSTPTPRGRDIRKMAKPYSCREAVFECSNGWKIEKCPAEDHPVEGFFMGHCLGGIDSHTMRTELSLREPDGTPHVTISCRWSELDEPYDLFDLGGRCNAYPKPEYVDLINEYQAALGAPLFTREKMNSWGQDDDTEYHEQGILTDKDYRDMDHGTLWRDESWRRKRDVSSG
jgi:hypothetical protein